MSLNYSKFNIGKIFVGNSSPNVYQSNNNILIGDIKGGSKSEFENKGKVITDVWSIMIIDLDIYKKIVDKYIKESPELNGNFDSLNERYNYYIAQSLEDADVCLKVEPGTYELIINKNSETNDIKGRMFKIN